MNSGKLLTKFASDFGVGVIGCSNVENETGDGAKIYSAIDTRERIQLKIQAFLLALTVHHSYPKGKNNFLPFHFAFLVLNFTY